MECQREESWSLISEAYSAVTWECVLIDGVFQGVYVSLLLVDFYEEILMGEFIHGPHFQPTHHAW